MTPKFTRETVPSEENGCFEFSVDFFIFLEFA